MSDVKPVPDGYTAITPYLVVEDAAAFLDFLANAFGAVERLRLPMPQGGIGHAEVEIGGAAVMLSDAAPPDFPPTKTQIHLYVEDVDGGLRPGRGSGRDLPGRARRPVLRRPLRPRRRSLRQSLVHRQPRRGCRDGRDHEAHGRPGAGIADRSAEAPWAARADRGARAVGVAQAGRGGARSKRRMTIPPTMSSSPITDESRIVSPTMTLMKTRERNGER